MPSHADIQDRYESALRAAKERVPGLDYTFDRSGNKIRFTIINRIPDAYRNDRISSLEDRFESEILTVSDMLDAHGLPSLEDNTSYSNGTGRVIGGNFHCDHELTDRSEIERLARDGFGFDPYPSELDAVANYRAASDNTPPVKDDAAEFARVDPQDLMTAIADNDIGPMTSIKDAVENYKKRKADERMGQRERTTEYGSPPTVPAPPPAYGMRNGRGNRGMRY